MVVLATLVLAIMARDLLMPNPKPRLMMVSFMDDMDMVGLDMLDSDMPDLDMLVSDMVVLDTLLSDMVVLAILVLAILVLAIMARDLLMLNPKPRLMLVSFMEDMDMVDLDML